MFLAYELLAVAETQSGFYVKEAYHKESSRLDFLLWGEGQNGVRGDERHADEKHGISSAESVWHEE